MTLDAWLAALSAAVLIGLASARATRLVTKDDFPPIYWARQKVLYARPPIVRTRKTWDPVDRRWVHDKSGDDPDYWWLGELVTCHWCASAYLSGAFTAAAWAWVSQVQHGSFPLPALVWGAAWWLAASQVQSVAR